MKTKKAQFDIFPVVFLVMVLIATGFWFFMVRGNEVTIHCNDINLTLVSINGMKYMDTGFFSGGTTKQKNLLFDNGLLLTFDDNNLNNVELYINGNYTITKCQEVNSKTTDWDRTYYKLKNEQEEK